MLVGRAPFSLVESIRWRAPICLEEPISQRAPISRRAPVDKNDVNDH